MVNVVVAIQLDTNAIRCTQTLVLIGGCYPPAHWRVLLAVIKACPTRINLQLELSCPGYEQDLDEKTAI